MFYVFENCRLKNQLVKIRIKKLSCQKRIQVEKKTGFIEEKFSFIEEKFRSNCSEKKIQDTQKAQKSQAVIEFNSIRMADDLLLSFFL